MKNILIILILPISAIQGLIGRASGDGAKWGEKCDPGKTDCDSSLHQVCDPTELKCICKFAQGLPNQEGQCQAGYDAPCNVTDTGAHSELFCNKDRFFQCNGGKCGCQNATTQLFDKELERCALIVGTEGCTLSTGASASTWTFNCVSNAVCESDNGTTQVPTCRCKADSNIDPETGKTCVKSSANALKALMYSSSFLFLILLGITYL